ncbi:CDP-alcohol phosphatidyltransferase family protein [soil metagenome]
MSERVLTVPNLVSAARLAAIPYFWWVLLGEERVGWAAALIFLIGATDWVDGYLARRLDQVTELGKILDPVADRLMIASALVGGLVAGVIPALFGGLLIAREVLVAVGGLVLARQGLGKLAVRPLGKVSTFLLYGAIPSFYLVAADIAPWLFGPPAWIGGFVGVVLYWWVGVQYALDLRSAVASVESSATNQEV